MNQSAQHLTKVIVRFAISADKTISAMSNQILYRFNAKVCTYLNILGYLNISQHISTLCTFVIGVFNGRGSKARGPWPRTFIDLFCCIAASVCLINLLNFTVTLLWP